MATSSALKKDPPIIGVRPAGQDRSRKLQDKFVKAGQAMLIQDRLADISIPAIAKQAKSSVGGFYSRFDNKDAFFEFLRHRMLEENGTLSTETLAPEKFRGKSQTEVCAAFIDLMIKIFSGPWRGVLREAYASIPEKRESWTPMRVRGQLLREMLATLLEPHVGHSEATSERIAFAVQLLFSMLNNELMNPNLKFSIADPQFRQYLIEVFGKLITDDAVA